MFACQVGRSLALVVGVAFVGLFHSPNASCCRRRSFPRPPGVRREKDAVVGRPNEGWDSRNMIPAFDDAETVWKDVR